MLLLGRRPHWEAHITLTRPLIGELGCHFLAERERSIKGGRKRVAVEGEERGVAQRLGWVCPLKCGCL